MFKRTKNRILNILLAAVLTLLALVILKKFFFQPVPLEQGPVINESNFKSVVLDHQKKIDQALLGLAGESLSASGLEELAVFWQEIEPGLKGLLPGGFKNAREWELYLYNIRTREAKALEYFKENNIGAAENELKTVQKELERINPQARSFKEIEKFENLIREISAFKDKEPARPKLEEIKLEFLFVKENFSDNRFSPILKEIEASLRAMDMYERADWLDARERLNNAVAELKVEIVR